jgi:hypothetical protein
MYILWNYDTDEPIAASTDKSLLEELMCDIFMEDYEDICNWDIYDKKNTPSDKKISYIADDVWDETVNYYNTYIDIISVPMI